MRPAVSVVVPVYDTEEHLARCLDSLVGQTLRDIEIVVVNDGSTDGSQAVIDGYVARFPEKIRAVLKENGGLADARNAGIRAATGAFLGFVDSDDWVEPRMFELLHARALAAAADIVVCDYRGIDSVTGAEHRYREGVPADFGASIHERPRLLIVNDASACNKLFRADLFSEDLMFPVGLDFEDLATTYRLFARAGRIEKVDEVLYHYVQRRGGAISLRWEGFMQLPEALDVLDSWYAKEGLAEEFRHELEYLNVLHLLKGRLPDLLASAPAEVTGPYLDAAYAHLDRSFPGWRRGRAVRKLCPGVMLRTLLTHKALLKALAGRSRRVVLGVSRRLGAFREAVA